MKKMTEDEERAFFLREHGQIVECLMYLAEQGITLPDPKIRSRKNHEKIKLLSRYDIRNWIEPVIVA